jgi:hypothetical protein
MFLYNLVKVNVRKGKLPWQGWARVGGLYFSQSQSLKEPLASALLENIKTQKKHEIRKSLFAIHLFCQSDVNSQPNHNMTSTNSGGRPANTNATRS